MNFELTLSGLWVLAIKCSEEHPVAPDAVDIIIPAAHRHRATLSYDFAEIAQPQFDQPLVVDTLGNRFTSLSLQDRRLAFTFQQNPYPKFALQWGSDEKTEPPVEEWMNWIPTLEDLGFEKLELKGDGIPDGASARITLPYGELFARELPRDEKTQKYLVWDFPATADENGKNATQRAIANHVVFRAVNVGELFVLDGNKQPVITAKRPEGTTLRMCISNDLEVLKPSDPMKTVSLDHLGCLKVLNLGGEFQAPELGGNQRTGGGPVCNGGRSMYGW